MACFIQEHSGKESTIATTRGRGGEKEAAAITLKFIVKYSSVQFAQLLTLHQRAPVLVATLHHYLIEAKKERGLLEDLLPNNRSNYYSEPLTAALRHLIYCLQFLLTGIS